MEGSRLLSVDSDKETAKKARGRPDISLWKIKDGERERLAVRVQVLGQPPYLMACLEMRGAQHAPYYCNEIF